MNKSLHYFLFFASTLAVSAQVPVSEEPSPPGDPIAQAVLDEQGGAGPSIFSDPEELSNIDGLEDPMERLKIRDDDANMVLDAIQMITGRYILRPQNLPQVKISFDSMNILTKRETLLALDSLLAMNGVGITKIDSQFYKAVPTAGINVHVPIWLDAPASSLSPSQRIYIKMFHLQYAPALEVREQLNPFATPSVGSLLVFEKANSILVTDALLNLQRMEKLLKTIDRPIRKEDLGTDFFIWSTKHAGARELEGKIKSMIEGSLKPFLGGTTQIDSDDRTGKLIIITRQENKETLWFFLEELDAPVKMKKTSNCLSCSTLSPRISKVSWMR